MRQRLSSGTLARRVLYFHSAVRSVLLSQFFPIPGTVLGIKNLEGNDHMAGVTGVSSPSQCQCLLTMSPSSRLTMRPEIEFTTFRRKRKILALVSSL